MRFEKGGAGGKFSYIREREKEIGEWREREKDIIMA